MGPFSIANRVSALDLVFRFHLFLSLSFGEKRNDKVETTGSMSAVGAGPGD